MSAYGRGDVVDCVVDGHADWGVLVQTPSGEPGWIESEYVDDVRVDREAWPEVGSTVTGVILGPLMRDGRWRLSSRPSSLAAAQRVASL